uniref:Putative membrane protein n=1 Tax=Nyssomyia neivai TaxID=330878 RepID=A0A1L8DAA2_9DIPT
MVSSFGTTNELTDLQFLWGKILFCARKWKCCDEILSVLEFYHSPMGTPGDNVMLGEWCDSSSCIRSRIMLVRRLKWLILILSSITFIYLIVFNYHTVNEHKDFSVYLQKLRIISDKLVSNGWDDTTVQQWRRSLEIPRESPQGNCLLNNIIVALPGDSLEEYLWEYISLLVLRERWKSSEKSHNITLGVFLAPKAKKFLEEVLHRVHMDSLENFPSNCLDLKHARILGHTNDLEMLQHNQPIPRLFLLESSAKRYMEIVHGDLKWLRQTVVLKKTLQDDARKEISQLRKSYNTDTFLLGFHYGETHFPHPVEAYSYRGAWNTVQLWHKHIGVLLICPKYEMNYCKSNFSGDPRVRIISSSTQSHALSLLLLCHGTIVRSDLSFIGALLNDGETVVLQSSVSEYDPAVEVAHRLPKWVTLDEY